MGPERLMRIAVAGGTGTLVTGPGAVHGRQTYARWPAGQPSRPTG
ncbi:hypothetical protein [Kineosporia sp. NBRC 101731]|nr:hypothetical protein [Kineosporia sp. NBRC 101731]